MEELYLPAEGGRVNIHICIWKPQCEPVAILQISHGMCEYMERYTQFAQYLNERGVLVLGGDHPGHGKTAQKDEDLGYFVPGDPSRVVVDILHMVMQYAKEKYPGLPYFMLGHSMGSFLARRFIMTYGSELDGVIITGTGAQAPVVLGLARFLVKAITAFKGERYRSPLMAKLSLGAYNKGFEPARTPNDWLTKDTQIVDKYNADKYCTFKFTMNGYKLLMDTFYFIQKDDNIGRIPRSIPILLASGEKDPVGNNGAGVKSVFEKMKKFGFGDLSIKLYKDDRHEILNETDREQVFPDLYSWMTEHAAKKEEPTGFF